MNACRVVAALLAMMLGAVMVSVLPSAPMASAAPPDGASSDSALTVSGKGDFANLKVTVSQTKNLINQVVTVTWTGGEPTVPVSGEFGVNYLQIMQCWGDGPDGPERTQCQFGGSNLQSSPAAGNWVRSRQLNYGNLVDPNETLRQPAGSFINVFLPFWAAGKDAPGPTDVVTSNNNDFFDSQVTNEVPLGRTHGDHTGLEFFEIQTVRQAAGLGCGDPVTAGGASTTTPRKCWLVVVPRGTKEVDGKPRVGSSTDQQASSPLSQSNWDNRILIPLEFVPVGQNCPIGSPERRMIGHELTSDAVSRWQPVLCAGGGAAYNYTQLGDDVARNLMLDGSSPGLALMTNPIPPERAPPDHPLVYAPVGLSGLAIAFNVEHQPAPDAPAGEQVLDGVRFSSMKLTPRLVAKLLTQSYLGSVQVPSDTMKNNAIGLTVDPEFLAINPEYKGFSTFKSPPDALVQLGDSDLTSLLWSWVKADADASAFVTGTPDPSKMVVNPVNQGFPLPTSTFPRNDESCLDNVIIGPGVKGKICTLDGHPFTNDMHDSGLSASRGDSQARTQVPDPQNNPVPKKVDRQVPGKRALLAVVDAATATRYGLPTAALKNTAGQFVAPTTDSLLAAETAMKPSAVPGVLAADPATTNPAAYPLTALSYAVTAPSTLDAAAGKDYATFLRYASGPGQQLGIASGQLPFGMAPLPAALKAQTIAAAATIEAQAGKAAGEPAGPKPASTGGAIGGAASTGGSNGSTGTNGTTTGRFGTPSPGAVAQVPGGSGGSVAAPNVAQQPVAGVRRTPVLPAPAVGALLLVILISGALAASSSPVMYVLGGVGRRLLRRGVGPVEQ